MIIEICGTGCAKCHTVEDNVRKTLQELGLSEDEQIKVADIKDPVMMAKKGVIFTPALLIDGVKMAEGKIPDVKEIKKWVEEKLPKK